MKGTQIGWKWIMFGCGHICVRALCFDLKGSPVGRRKHETEAGKVESARLKRMASTRRVYGERKEEDEGPRTLHSQGQAKRRETRERNRGQRGRSRIRRQSSASTATEKASKFGVPPKKNLSVVLGAGRLLGRDRRKQE